MVVIEIQLFIRAVLKMHVPFSLPCWACTVHSTLYEEVKTLQPFKMILKTKHLPYFIDLETCW